MNQTMCIYAIRLAMTLRSTDLSRFDGHVPPLSRHGQIAASTVRR
jgi:hypothetical protein